MITQHVEYRDGDTVLEGYAAWDSGPPAKRPAVLVCHAIRGRDVFACQKAEALAALGYVGFALDNYGKGIAPKDHEEGRRYMGPLMADRAALRRRLLVGLETVRGLDAVDPARVAAIGFCFGGLCTLDLARSGADLRGVVPFHGLFTPLPADVATAPVRAKVLALHGWDDPMVPPDSVVALAAELTAAGADWQIHAYGHTQHAFTNPFANDPERGTVYDESADRRSWTATTAFLAEVLA